MLVADLHHFLDLPDEVPGPARRLAERLGDLVRAASAGDVGDVGDEWETALLCPRRPGRRRCAGRMIVRRGRPEASIDWRCSGCGDAGVISNWQDSPFDLRHHHNNTGRGVHLTVAEPVQEIVIDDEVAAALRDLQLLDPDCERLVFRIRSQHGRAVLAGTEEDLEQLVGAVAAEANHEPDRRRQQRLDAAFEALSAVVGGW